MTRMARTVRRGAGATARPSAARLPLPLLLTLTGACSAPGAGTPPAAPPAPAPGGDNVAVAASPLLESQTCGVERPSVRALRTADELAAFMARGPGANRLPAPPPPAVDFSATGVLVVALGRYPSGGHAVRLTGAATASPGQDGAGAAAEPASGTGGDADPADDGAGPGRVITVTVDVTHPPPDAMTVQMLTSPCVLVGLPADAGERVRVVDQHGALLGTVTW